MIPKIKEILQVFNQNNIKYCVLRNYAFLLNQGDLGTDLDISVDDSNWNNAEEILLNQGFNKSSKNFSLKHQGFWKYFPENKKTFSFDLQKGGIYWNDIVYLKMNQILSGIENKYFFPILSVNDSYLHYLCHSILGKRFFKHKYKEELVSLSQEDLNFSYIKSNLAQIFNKKIALFLLKNVQEGTFEKIERRMKFLASYYAFKDFKRAWTFTKLSARWFFSRKYCPLRKVPLLNLLMPSKPLISLIGPDGSGKSTMTEGLVSILKNNGYPVNLIYVGRGKKNIIPIKKIGNIYKGVEKKKKVGKNLKKIIYSLSSPIYTLDLLIRYLFIVLPKRKRFIVVTDRYCSDILLMKHVPFFLKRFFLSFFPKPSLTFYLYNDPNTLYNRKRDQSPEELSRQMGLFEQLSNNFEANNVKTDNKELNLNAIVTKTLSFLNK